VTATLVGPRSWSGSRDDQTFTEYELVWLVRTTDTLDGPNVVMNCPGLPTVGSTWNIGNDSDQWAYCYPTLKVTMHGVQEGMPGYLWTVAQKFSTKPLIRCNDTPVQDPMQEPMKISGSFVKYTQEYRYDRFGNFLTNSALELLRGPDTEFDANRPTVRIEQNVLSLDLPTFSAMVDCVNAYPLWGLPARCIKLSEPTWERKTVGTCSYYYTRTLNFDINFNTFDRYVGDFGTMVLKGQWNTTTGAYVVSRGADRTNPQHFMRYVDIAGNPATVVLNGYGLPAGTTLNLGTGTSGGSTGPMGQIKIERYSEADFTLLNIPTSL